MKENKKQVIMTYEEHEGWLYKQKEHEKEIKRMAELMVKQEEIMKKLIEERDDIVVIERHQMMVQKDWRPRGGYGMGYTSYEDRYLNFPRFLSGDDLSKALDDGFMEMHGEIRELQGKLSTEKACRKKDKIDFNKMNKAIPINVWNSLSDRQRERIRKILHKAHQKAAKK